MASPPDSWATYAVLNKAWKSFAFVEDERLSERHKRSVLFIAYFAPIATLSFWGYAVFYLLFDASNLWPASVICGLGGLCFLIMPYITRYSVVWATYALFAFGTTTFLTLCFFFGAESGLNLGILTGCVLILMMLGTGRSRVLASVVVPALVCAIVAPIVFVDPYLNGVTPNLLRYVYQSMVLSIVALTSIALILAVRQVEIAETALAKEHGRSEKLLANLVPESIAARLKTSPEKSIAENVPQATVLFADIVNFTPRAAKMEPEELVAFLNRVFSRFDALAQEYSLEKIKTIGDAHMLAGGLPEPRSDHASACARMALDMVQVCADLSVEMGEELAIRVGMHSGSATAGVIGTTKFFYDIWGDTVNTASRLETDGEPGRIQVSTETKNLLADEFDFEPRGIIDLKGKGPIETWWLIGSNANWRMPSQEQRM